MYRQPRVPQMQGGESIMSYVRMLSQFLKEFCLGAWRESLETDKRLKALEKRIASLEEAKKEG